MQFVSILAEIEVPSKVKVLETPVILKVEILKVGSGSGTATLKSSSYMKFMISFIIVNIILITEQTQTSKTSNSPALRQLLNRWITTISHILAKDTGNE